MSRSKHILFLLVIIFTFVVGVFFGRRSTSFTDDKAPHDIIIRDTIKLDAPTLAEVRVGDIPDKVDTLAVVDDYYCQRIYVDTISANQFVTIVVRDTVTQNRLEDMDIQVVTHYPAERRKNHSLSLRGETGYNIANLSCEYNYRNFGVFAGYNFAMKTPVVGLKYVIKEW